MKSHQLIDRAWVKQSVYSNVVNKDNRERQVQAELLVMVTSKKPSEWGSPQRRQEEKEEKKIRLN